LASRLGVDRLWLRATARPGVAAELIVQLAMLYMRRTRIVALLAVLALGLLLVAWAAARRRGSLEFVPSAFRAELEDAKSQTEPDGEVSLSTRGPWTFVLCDSVANAVGPRGLEKLNATARDFGEFRVIQECGAPRGTLLDSLRCAERARICYEVGSWTPIVSSIDGWPIAGPHAGGTYRHWGIQLGSSWLRISSRMTGMS